MKNKIYQIGIFFILSLVLASSLSAQEVIDRVVAIVNDDLITLSELKEASLTLDPASNEQMDDRTLLNQMVESKLFEQEAEKRGIKVSEEELDASIEGVRARYNLNEDQMEEVLKKQNLTPEAFREQWRVQLLGNKLLESQLRNKIVITDDEVREYYEQNYGEIDYSEAFSSTEDSQEEVEIAHILISPESPDAVQKAQEVAQLAKSGDDFSTLAREYSDDSFTADKGGNLGTFKKGDLIETLEVAVERTSVGDVTGPVESPAGYHVLKVLKRTKADNNNKKDDKKSAQSELDIPESQEEEIRDIIHRQKAQEQLKTWLEEMRESAYVEIKL
ncbi:MAG: peptidylprolyl isomerase [Thermodesulfobacteriota bacterium]